MGQRGPSALPTEIKQLHGETRKARLNYDRPKPRNAPPVMPRDLSPEAARVWRRILRETREANVIKAADRDALRIYCETVVRYEEASAALAASQPLLRGARGGSPVKNPLHQIVRDNAALVRAYARELGLTPAAREGLKAGAKVEEEADPFETWRTGAIA